MHPVLLKLGPLNVYSYGVMVALGFALATACIYMRAPGFGIDRNSVVDLMILMLVSGILGARTLYILQNLGYYLANPYEMPNLSKGGLVWYGAFIAGLGASAVYIKKKRMDFWTAVDLAAPYIALAQAVGRIGCFLNGCCYGIEATPGPLASFAQPSVCDTVLRYPAQLYSAASLLLIFAILRIWQDHRRFKGEIFLGYCMLYSSKRFLMEFVRGDNPRIFFNLTMSQLISCILLTASLATFIYMAAAWKKRR
jgi:phosphatidylglycerol:prolipoprotein diacylglycerol transferase